MTKRLTSRLIFAAIALAGVGLVPGLLSGSGSTGAASDLGLGKLLAEGSALAYAVAFAGGVLTSLTPCVYPLIPITVSVFGAKKASSRGQAVALSGLYVIGIAIMYSALGVAAALTGKAFGSVMTNPWVIGFVVIVFLAMAASMFGAFDLNLPPSLQAKLTRVGGAGHLGALAMGLVAGIVAAPCTGPVLAAALTFVATKGSVAFGFGIMLAYALGMGLLFFLIGAFSVHMPKSGAWMETVKSLFGVALLALAAVYLKNLVPHATRFFSAASAAAWVAAGAATLGVLAGALHASFHGGAGEKLLKGVSVALLVGGIVYGVGAADAREQAALAQAPFPWVHDGAVVSAAQKEGKPAILDFWADWCKACNELDVMAWADPRVKAEARRFVTVKFDGSNDSPEFKSAYDRYHIVGMPTVIFLDKNGKEAKRITAAIPAEKMLAEMKSID